MKGSELMGVLKDVLDGFKDIMTATDDAAGTLRKNSRSSISRAATEGIMQFPVLVSRSLDADTSQLVSKALEKNYASFVQIVLTMNPNARVDQGSRITDYLRQFHQNTDVKTNIWDVKNSMVAMAHENLLALDKFENCYVLSIIYEGSNVKICNENKKKLRPYGSDINTDILNNKFIPNKEYNLNSRIVSESLLNKYQPTMEDAVSDAHAKRIEAVANKINAEADAIRVDATRVQSQTDINKAKAAHTQAGVDALNALPPEERQAAIIAQAKAMNTQNKNEKIEKLDNKGPDINYTLPRDVLKWSQIEKLNEMAPTHLQVKVKGFDKDNKHTGDIEFIMGVKTTLHPIDSQEMTSNLVAACKNNNHIFNFIKWTTGEIEFFKDFLFGMNEIKDDVTNRSAGASSWWISLKRRRVLADIKKFIFLPNNILPNTTIVISQEEVNFIKSQYGFDLMSPYFLNNVMQAYFLLGFVVVDNSTQIVHFMFDGQVNFQSYTFKGLEKEVNNRDEFKQMLKMVNRL
jgi:hypothetical protein